MQTVVSRLAQRAAYFMFAAAVTTSAVKSQGQCPPILDDERTSILRYVGSRFHAPLDKLTLETQEQNPTSCVSKLTFRAVTPTRYLHLYLTPDHHFLVPVLFDVRGDPTAEERSARTQVMQAISSLDLHGGQGKASRVQLAVFSDFQCPFCKALSQTLQALADHGDLRDVSVVMYDFPLPVHSWARKAALVDICVSQIQPSSLPRFAAQLFTQQESLKAETFDLRVQTILSSAGVQDVGAIEGCLRLPSTAEILDHQIAVAQLLGVDGTPTLFINGARSEGLATKERIMDLVAAARATALSE